MTLIRYHGGWLARFYSRTEWADGHLLWTGRRNEHGYGLYTSRNKNVRVHRVAWEVHHGLPIPEGLVPDHLCKVRHCLNPEHLELVPGRLNTLRGSSPAAQNARKTRCKNGHLFTTENTYIIPSTGARTCRTCKTAADRRRYERRRSAAD